MSLYEGVAFKGTFRRYQQRVLDNAKQYIAKGKVNIVASPGRGKTILGLELIRRCGTACLIVSPTVATRDRWGKQFKEYFLKDEKGFKVYFSTNVEHAAVINAMTYEELEDYTERYATDGEKKSFKLRRMMREKKIQTICLEEPHHLKPECLAALGKMREVLEKDVKIISLTTTPPCAYEEEALKRFMEVCGEIDVQILASELVAEEVLCPHQDYIYFNVPSEEEEALFREYMEKVESALKEIGQLPCVKASVNYANQRKNRWYYFYSYEFNSIKKRAPEAYMPILQLLSYYGVKQVDKLAKIKELPPIQLKDMQIALQYLMDYYDILKSNRKFILQVLQKYELYQRKKVQLVPHELMQRVFPSSAGKLQSMGEIVNREYEALGKELRLLVFADEGQPMSIFEVLYTQNPVIKIGVFGKDLLILPMLEELQGTMMQMEPLGDTGYGKVELFGNALEAIDCVKDLLREGKLQVLIGSRSLLEEDWEESGINTLILPGFSEDFFLANKIRGIALQRSADQPEKTVNIWHLTTMMPAKKLDRFRSKKVETRYLETYDLDRARDRFRLFMGPDYEIGEMEQRINRLLSKDLSLDRRELQYSNEEMLQFAADREEIRKLWEGKIQWLKNKRPGKIH